MNKIITIALVIITLLVSGLYFKGGSDLFGATGTRMPNGISADSTSPVAGEVRGTTLTITSTSAFTGAMVAGAFTQGGGTVATTSNGAGTLTAANLDTGVIEHTNTAVTTLTLPASTTLTSFVPTSGQCRQVVFLNLGTSVDTLAGGSGTLLAVASTTSTGAALKTVNASGISTLVFCRKANTDVQVLMTPGS